jgi:hypothetical protein
MAPVTMPETSVDEDHGTALRENEIRLSGHVFMVQTEAKPSRMQAAPDD